MKFWAIIKAITAVFLGILQSVTITGFPRVPHQKDFTLVWSDEFDGNALDQTKWEGHYCGAGDPTVRHGSYWHTDMATVKDGNLRIRTEYYPDGYTFYINGIKTGHSDFGGASQVPEYLLLAVEVGGSNAEAAACWAGGPLTPDCPPTDFIIDYVRVYQYK